jgi:hypothetical protein
VTRAREASLEAEELLHLNGKRQLITAEKELRVDAEIINMG